MRFSLQDVRDIISHDHKRNTADALGKAPECVTNDELICHWVRYHLQREVVHFHVGDAFFPSDIAYGIEKDEYGDQGGSSGT